MAKPRTSYKTKSGSYYGFGPRRKGRGKPVPRISNREHRNLGTLQARNRRNAHARKKGILAQIF